MESDLSESTLRAQALETAWVRGLALPVQLSNLSPITESSVSPFVRHTSTFLKRLKRELNFTVCADIQNIFRQILRTQSIWLGERFISHSLYFHVQGLLLDQCSWLLFPLLLTLTRREGIYLSVHVEGYFGVHS